MIAEVNPARAGMIRAVLDNKVVKSGKPRASGDDPPMTEMNPLASQ